MKDFKSSQEAISVLLSDKNPDAVEIVRREVRGYVLRGRGGQLGTGYRVHGRGGTSG